MICKKSLLVIGALVFLCALVVPQMAFAEEGAQPGSPLAAGVIDAPDETESAAQEQPVVLKRLPDGVYRIRSAKAKGVALCDPEEKLAKGVQMKSAKASTATSQKFYLRNEGDGLVSLQVVASGLFLGESGGRVVQRADSSDARMRWRLESARGVKVVNAATGSVLSLSGGKAVKGKRAIVARDASNASQRWAFSSTALVADGYYRVKSSLGTYLDVRDASCAYGANVRTWSGNYSGAETFRIYAQSGGYYRIENAKSFLLVDVSGGSTRNKANVVQSKKSAKARSLWKPVLDRSGNYVFKNKKSGKVLEVADSSAKRGANVRQAKPTGARGQRWKLEKAPKYSLSGDSKFDRRVAENLRATNDLRSAYNWTVRHPYREGQRYYSNPHVLPASKTISLASDFFSHGSGNCYRFAAAFCWLARGLGYQSNVISGWVNAAGGGRAPHGWVEIVVGGRTYVCDPDLQHELPAYNWFMTTYATSPTAYHSW